MIRIVCQQVAPRVGELVANRRLVEAAIRGGVVAGADLIVLPELVTSGYVFHTSDEVRAAALPPRFDSFDYWVAALGDSDALVVGGFPELAEDGTIYNSVVLLSRHELLATYRKTHLWDEEKTFFTPGDAMPPVVATTLGPLGLLVCYDLEFPETTRSLALRGATLIVVPTNWPRGPRPEGERPAEMGNAQVAARLNRVFVACCDRVGEERGVEWNGGSCVVDPEGWVVEEIVTRDVGSVVADVDLDRARDKSLNENNDVLGDRRVDLYGDFV